MFEEQCAVAAEDNCALSSFIINNYTIAWYWDTVWNNHTRTAVFLYSHFRMMTYYVNIHIYVKLTLCWGSVFL